MNIIESHIINNSKNKQASNVMPRERGHWGRIFSILSGVMRLFQREKLKCGAEYFSWVHSLKFQPINPPLVCAAE